MDRREEVISNISGDSPYVYRPDVIKIMDEYFTERALELLEYMAKNMVICGHYSSSDGPLFKVKGHELITKEQLFENFL